jgi:hypothetical protein
LKGIRMSETIGWAVKQMQDGQKVCRAGWNGKGMSIFIAAAQVALPGSSETRWTPGNVYLLTARGDIIAWNCSQADLVATDWEIAE